MPHVVTRAWVDSVFRKWLLEDATAAIALLGYAGRQGECIVALERISDLADRHGQPGKTTVVDN
jgi:nitrile hydratase